MNAQDMIDYALGQMEGPARERFERALAADPSSSLRVDRLEAALVRLLDDGERVGAENDDYELHRPPAGLVSRTVGLVAEARSKPKRKALLDFVPARVPFRWADVAVAASIFLAGVLTLLPAMHRSREGTDRAACGFNLQQIFVGLMQYGNRYGVYPYASAESGSPHVGAFAAMLHDEDLLHDASTLNCPCTGPCPNAGIPDLATLARWKDQEPERYQGFMDRTDYAYNVGYRLPTGRPGPIPAGLQATIPLVSDKSPFDRAGRILAGNSPNHDGRGQNVVFSDGHVSWHPTRRVSPVDDDMFLNDDDRPAPSVHLRDSVLVPSSFRFDGR